MFIRNRNFAGLAYHDPVYDETGGQGGTVQTMAPAAAPDPTLLYVAIGIVLILLFQEQ